MREGNWAPATEAYLWGYPLLSIQRTRKLLCSRTRPGVFKAIPTLATPRDRAVVVPNNDTLYASGWYDLRQGDLELAVPPMDHPGRYWNLMVVDAYTRVSYLRRADYGVGGLSARVTWDPEGGGRSGGRRASLRHPYGVGDRPRARGKPGGSPPGPGPAAGLRC